MTNNQIAKLLRNVAASYQIKDEKKYRFQIIAYQRAADAIESSTQEISDLLKEDRLEELPGVGPSIRDHLTELMKTGKVKRFAWIMQNIPTTVFTLMDVPSFGPKKAYKLATQFHLKNPKTVIEDIKKLAEQGKIASLEGFGEKSQEDILRAFREFKEGSGKTKRMVLPFANELAQTLTTYLEKSPEITHVQTLGSLRRMKETVGDIDIAIATKSPEKSIEHFTKYPYIDRLIERGSVSVSALVSGGKQVDIIALPPQNFGSLLQHFTGSKNHNVHLREYALKKGLSLSERGIKRKNKQGKEELLVFDTEEKFYSALGMNWIPPEIREDSGEIEASLANKLPELVTLKEIKGDLHIHSNFPIEPSHDMGQTSMEDMLSYAQKLDYAYLGFSEHNPSISKHSKDQIYSILARRKKKIEQLSKSNKYIQIINLLEVDILANGELAIDNKAFSYLDAAIISIHSAFSMDKKAMTNRVLKALAHPKAKILAHPTGRLLNQRPGYELEWDRIFDFVKKHNKALEINAWPQRLDLPDIIVREAVKAGVKFVIDTDSHSVEQMNMMQYGVFVARRGWAEKKDILNALRYEDFKKWLTL